MAEEVEIGNVGGKQGIASEATLERLVRTLEKQTKNSNPKVSEDVKKLAKESKEGSKDVKDFSEEIENTTTIVEDFGSGLASVGSSIISGFKAAGDYVFNFGETLLFTGNRLSDFAEFVPLIGGPFGSLIENLEKNIDSFRNLSESGASFNNSIISLRASAAAAGLPLDEFARMISENSSSMLLLGGSVTQGAKRFSLLTNQIRHSQEDFMGMGFTIQQLNEGTASFLELQASQGRLQRMSDAQLRSGTEEYLKDLDALAKITGKQRDQIAEEMNKQAQEANILAIQQNLSGEALKNFRSSLIGAAEFGPAVETAFKDLADGIPQTAVGEKIAALSPEFVKLAKDAAAGRVTQQEFYDRMKSAVVPLQNLTSQFGAAGTSALMTQEGFGEILSTIGIINKTVEKQFDPKLAEDEQNQRNAATSTLARFEQVIADVRARFETAFINSGVLDFVMDQVNDFGKGIEYVGKEVGDFVLEVFESSEFKSIVANFKQVLTNLKDNFMSIASDIANFNFSSALNKLFSGTSNPFSSTTGISSAGDESRSSTSSSSSGLFNFGGSDESGGFGGGMFGGLMGLLGIDWTDIALAIGGVTLAVAALGKVVTLAIPGFAAMGGAFAAVGLAAAGIGTAFAGASLLVEGLGEAISGVVNSISDLMTAQKSATTEQIQQLTQIDDQAMHDAAAGITAMKEALDGFGPGMLDSIGGAIGGLLGDDMGDQVNYMKQIASVGPELSVAGEGMAAISSAAKQLDDSNIRAYTEAVEELVEAMKDLNSELSKDNNGMLESGTGANAGSVLGGMSGGGTAEKLDQLNMLMSQMLQVLQQGTRYSRDTTRAIRGQGDLQQGF